MSCSKSFGFANFPKPPAGSMDVVCVFKCVTEQNTEVEKYA